MINFDTQALARGPAGIVTVAIEKINDGTESSKNIGFLLLDLATETIMKTFLALPKSITKAETSDKLRKEILNGHASFANVLQAVDDAVSNTLNKDIISRVSTFHGVRNMIYHRWLGQTISESYLFGYAKNVLFLLNTLLGVDLRQLLHSPEDRAREEAMLSKLCEEIEGLKGEINALKNETVEGMEYLIDLIEPALNSPTFWFKIKRIKLEYEKDLDAQKAEENLLYVLETIFIDLRKSLSEYVMVVDPDGSEMLYSALRPRSDLKLDRIIDVINIGGYRVTNIVLRDFFEGKHQIIGEILFKVFSLSFISEASLDGSFWLWDKQDFRLPVGGDIAEVKQHKGKLLSLKEQYSKLLRGIYSVTITIEDSAS